MMYEVSSPKEGDAHPVHRRRMPGDLFRFVVRKSYSGSVRLKFLNQPRSIRITFSITIMIDMKNFQSGFDEKNPIKACYKFLWKEKIPPDYPQTIIAYNLL
jgi:hypothetical protein